MQSKIDIFSRLFRELEAEIGTRDMGILVLRALCFSIKELDVNDAEKFIEEFDRLADMVSQTEPKFGILNYNFARLSREFKRDCENRKLNARKWKRLAIAHVDEILRNNKEKKSKILKNAMDINVEGKTILIHDHSHTVQDVLVSLKRAGKHFRVVIAEQDYDKTHSNIERMHKAKIPFQVVPAYMLSHVHDQIDMAFFGSVTLKDTMHFVMDPGTAGTISEFHLDKVPIYMFINTMKFSLWKSKERGEIFIRKHKRKHSCQPIEYERIKYSHDRVPVKLFHRIVTDRGVMTPAQLKDLFRVQMKKYGGDQ